MKTNKEAFKLGMLKKMAEYGVTPAQAEAYLRLSPVKGAFEKTSSGYGPAALILSLAAAGAIPYVGGKLTGKIHGDLAKENPSVIKRMTIAQQTQAIQDKADRLRKQVKSLRKKKTPTPGPDAFADKSMKDDELL